MRKITTIISLLFASLLSTQSQNLIEQSLWKRTSKADNGSTDQVENSRGHISNITVPTITVYPPNPSCNTGIALLICPGGGYSFVASQHEGHQFAKWLSTKGVTGIVLKYRLPNGNCEIPLTDAKRAMTIIRKSAKKWGIDKHKIGVAGFSAGGHLASTLSTQYDKKSKPNFAILIYPVISMRDGVTHSGSRTNLIGQNPDEELIKRFSNAENVNQNTPPTLLIHCKDDTTVPIKNSEEYAAALERFGVNRVFSIYEKGGHGFGMNTNSHVDGWQEMSIEFLRNEQFIPSKTTH